MTMLAYALIVFSIAYAHGLQVNTTEGPVEGSISSNGTYYEFYGIPYAGPTSGKNRFKGPVPPPRRSGLFHANDSTVICAQPGSNSIVGVEDCLTLSVMTTNVTTSKPVIVFLNSEEYTNAPIPQYSPRLFMESDVVFINMNFRLSIFGFLCLGVQEAPGNAGLRDVIQGLKWIKANIANFGGDTNNVILMGHGSGAAMVDLLTLSPQTKNLVHKGVALSGSGLAPWAVAYDPIGNAKLLGDELFYIHKSPSDLANHLITTYIDDFNTPLNEFNFYNSVPLFAPCVENPKLNPNDTVLAEAPINILRSGNYSQIPFIYGYTTLEGTMRLIDAAVNGWRKAMQENFSKFLPVDLQLGNNKTAVAKQIRDFYVGNSWDGYLSSETYIKYEGDTLVLVSVIRAAKERALTSKANVRLLEFDYVSSEEANWVANGIFLDGAIHGAFLRYLLDYENPLKSAVDEEVCKSIVTRFSAFAHDWYPGGATAGSTDRWAAITKNNTKYLFYGSVTNPVNHTGLKTEELRNNPHKKRITFWDNLYAKYYVTPSRVSSSSVTVSCFFLVMLCQVLAVRLA